MKYIYMARFSILAVGIIFLLQVSQAFLVYRLFETNSSLLHLELNSVTESAYNKDLTLRLEAKGSIDIPDVKFYGTTPSSGADTIKVAPIDANTVVVEKNKGFVPSMTLTMEEFISKEYPINLLQIDSLAGAFLKQNNINLKFYSEIVDKDTGKVLETTLNTSYPSSDILYSKEIPLNVKQTKVLRLGVINPTWKIYPQMGWMLGFSLLLSIFCIYNLHVQKKVFTKQRKLAHLKNGFFSEVSHEFKRPLAVLRQTINSLGNEKVLLNEEKRSRMLRIGEEEIINMTNWTEMFLSLAQDEEGLFELHPVEFDIAKVVFDLADKVVETTPGSPEIDVDNELKDPMIFADKDHIEHLVSNLISNAIKYSKESIDIRIKLYKENNNICISVKDTGVGISAEDLGVIFEKYSRVGKTTHARGHGIGLSYVKRIAEKHGGSISVKSELNIGSEFIVKLPLVNNA